jgi:hypothetical protein
VDAGLLRQGFGGSRPRRPYLFGVEVSVEGGSGDGCLAIPARSAKSNLTEAESRMGGGGSRGAKGNPTLDWEFAREDRGISPRWGGATLFQKWPAGDEDRF